MLDKKIKSKHVLTSCLIWFVKLVHDSDFLKKEKKKNPT